MIRLRTLGALELSADDPASDVGSLLTRPKCVALLAYLAVARPHGMHRRDKLFALFWSEYDARHASASLRQAVHVLGPRLGDRVLLRRGGAELGLDEGGLWCDVVAFEDASRAGDVERALALYRGDFLDGFFVTDAPEFEGWMESERARLAREYARLLERKAEQHEARGELDAAIECWARLVERDVLNGRLVLRLMSALDSHGERARALAEARQHARALAAELDAAPEPAVARLAERLRAAP